MSAPSAQPSARSVESTYKTRDVESALDIYFYRPIGYALALFFAKLRFTPSMVSLLGGSIGVLAGHLYYYSDVRLNVIAMALHVLTNALDNADGQLARLTNRGSIHGAIMDGFADYIVFMSVYVHLCLRYMAEGGSAAIWLLAVAAAMSHAMQSMTIDYLRYGYLQFVTGKRSADANASETVRAVYDATSWRDFLKKLGLRNYLNYTRQQERLAPNLLRLRLATRETIPEWLTLAYRRGCRPLVKWCNCLATNPRMFLLFAFLLIGQPVWYFAVELTLLNVVLVCVLLRHDAVFRSLLARLHAAG
ncbi:MAG TPA: CDP-alcohol phosphatidyltransferase family protein [Chthoniobacterales bacterium]|nr:CDP-alcohol phosphatidyltransferase family protein [Chthoniobacterales bacterium]